MRIFAAVAVTLLIPAWVLANRPDSSVYSKSAGACRGDSIESAKLQIPNRQPETPFRPVHKAATTLIVFPDGITIEVKPRNRPRETLLRSGWTLGDYEKFANQAKRGNGGATPGRRDFSQDLFGIIGRV